jgi:hypothetical protein
MAACEQTGTRSIGIDRSQNNMGGAAAVHGTGLPGSERPVYLSSAVDHETVVSLFSISDSMEFSMTLVVQRLMRLSHEPTIRN